MNNYSSGDNNGVFNESERKIILEDFRSIVKKQNSKANILTNWLYGLSTGGLVIMIKDHINKTKLPCSFWFFLFALIFCILSTAFEWYRDTKWVLCFPEQLKKLDNEEINKTQFLDSLSEKKFILCIITLLRILGYAILIFGIFSVIYSK